MTPSDRRLAHLIRLVDHLAGALEAIDEMQATGVDPDDKRTACVLRAFEAQARKDLQQRVAASAAPGGAA